MVGEFEFIDNLRSKYGLKMIGDDCAVLPKDARTDLLLTADMLVENVDFRLEWIPPELLGHKALAISLSDIAAMGGQPVWAMLSIGIPKSLWKGDFADRFYEGWFKLAKEIRVDLVGGDVSRSPDRLVIDSIVGGEIGKGTAILRSSAKIGDLIVVTGDLGGAAAGLQLLQTARFDETKGDDWQKILSLKHLKPTPQLATATYLHSNDLATSMIDISDGLSSDLGHICKGSSVGATIYAESIPLNPYLTHIAPSMDHQLDLALNGGEDFELLFTADPKKISQLDDREFSVIGEVTETIGIIKLMRAGNASVLAPKGYRHF